MDILVQKPNFCPSSSECYVLRSPSAYYAPYNTPPYIAQSAAAGSWPDEPQLPPMQYLRFPTPPVTPEQAATTSYSPPPRTQSVIMKCSTSISSSSGCGSRSPTESCSDHSSNSECDFFCNWQDCGIVFESLEALAQHVTLRHAIASLLDGLYYCRWGGCQRSDRGFNARYKMLVHVRTHTKEKPHRCHLCEKCFSRAENLKIHIRSHSGEKPYKCHFEGCQKAYSNSSDRFKHTRTHSMEKPYKCKVPGCQKRYTDPSSLRKHVKTFKHSIQLIASQKKSNCLLDDTESAYSRLPQSSPAPVALDAVVALPAAPATRYFLDDGDFRSSGYWLNARERSYRYLHSEDFAMDLDLDASTPLDLRVHRS